MREVKFRAFQDNQMLTQPISGVYGAKRLFGLLYEDTELMQYIGLKDKNDVEIYEGDIISDHVGVGVVEYAEKYAGFRVNYGNGRAKWFYDYNLRGERGSIEVIGNVHENSEIVLKEWD